MKLTEFIKDIFTNLVEKPEDADLILAASDLKAVEIPDDVISKFNQKYLTRDRAMNDDEILRKMAIDARGRVFDSIDLKIKKLKGKLSPEDQDAIDAEKNTLLKMDLLERALDNVGNKGDDVKKVNEAFRKKEAEFHEKISALENQLKEKDSTFGKQIKDVKLDYGLRTKLSSLESSLAPEFATEKHKTFLAESTINHLKKNFVLEFDEKDESIIHLRNNVDGIIKDVYEGNTKLTLNDVLKKEYDPYLKKSTPGHNPPPEKKTIEVPSDKPVTLRDRHLQAAQLNGDV